MRSEPFAAPLIQRRIERAKQLLRTGQPIVDTALQFGFADQAHFTKRFKALVGAPLPPTSVVFG